MRIEETACAKTKEWQPIESAPKNAKVLVRCASGQIEVAEIGDYPEAHWSCSDGALYDVIEWSPIPK